MDKEWIEYLGEAIHTAFRKGGRTQESHTIWKLIKDLPDEEWETILAFVYECVSVKLEEEGQKVKQAIKELVEENEQLRKRMVKLEEALRYYANSEIYEPVSKLAGSIIPVEYYDKGRTAQQALEE